MPLICKLALFLLVYLCRREYLETEQGVCIRLLHQLDVLGQIFFPARDFIDGFLVFELLFPQLGRAVLEHGGPVAGGSNLVGGGSRRPGKRIKMSN